MKFISPVIGKRGQFARKVNGTTTCLNQKNKVQPSGHPVTFVQRIKSGVKIFPREKFLRNRDHDIRYFVKSRRVDLHHFVRHAPDYAM